MMALDLVCFATRQPKSRSPHSCSLGPRLVTTVMFSRWSTSQSQSCTSMPPTIRFMSKLPQVSRLSWPVRMRMSFLAARMSMASSLYPGAHRTSTKICEISRATASSTTRFSAMTPPKAETGSQLKAFS